MTDLVTLTAIELRELARLMNAAKRVDVGRDGLSLVLPSSKDADRAQELLAKQGRNPSRINDLTLSVARRAR